MLRQLPVLVCAIAGLLSGCATVDHKVLFDEKDRAGKDIGGIPYYEPAIYLLAYSDGDGNVTAEFKVMPDQSHKMVAKPFNFLSKVDTTMTYDGTKGILSKHDAVIDATEVPKAIGEALSGMAKAAVSALALAEKTSLEEGKVPGPKLYKLVREANGQFVLYGSKDTKPILVTLRPKPPTSTP